jgi:DNA-binding Lrp family transcriptional regulator
MTNERDLMLKVQTERIERLERALCELADDLHRVASVEQVRSSGHPAVASLLADRAHVTQPLETAMKARELKHA